MSKEYLDAFKNLKQELYYSPNQIPDIDKWHETIEKALQRLEAIDNIEPNEALKCLIHIKKDDFNMIITTYPPLPAYNSVTKDEMLDKIEQSLIKAQEQEKVLEIINNKTVSVFQIKCCKNALEYNDLKFLDKEKLTKEEFYLLKRYLENE